MPEGDTIHRAAARIGAVLVRRVPAQIGTPQPRHRADRWPERLAGRAVRAVDAHGKHLFVRFEGDLTLHSHLRMTGAWGVHREGERWRRAVGRAWLVLRCEGWEVVEFDGPVLELMSDARTRSDPRLATLGQDVLGERFDVERFLRLLRARRLRAANRRCAARPAHGRRHRQRVEGRDVLRGRDRPVAPLGEVSDEEALALLGFARKHMRIAVREGPGARPGAVYGRAGRPCLRCGSRIRQRGQGEHNRQTFWCPDCQR